MCPSFSHVSIHPITGIIYSVALARFSTTTDEVYDNLMRSHDPSGADFVAVEATVLNVSVCVDFSVVTMTTIVNQMRDAVSELRRTVAMSVVCVCLSVCLSVFHCYSHLKPAEEIEGDEELEDLTKPPRPASPLDYTESNVCKCIM